MTAPIEGVSSRNSVICYPEPVPNSDQKDNIEDIAGAVSQIGATIGSVNPVAGMIVQAIGGVLNTIGKISGKS